MKDNCIKDKIEFKKHKSLKNRFKFMVNISTLFTVIIMSMMFLFILNRVLFIIGTSTSEYYIEHIEMVVSRITESNKDNLESKDFLENNMFQKEVDRLSNIIPVFSIKVEIHGETVFERNSRIFLKPETNQDFNDLSFEFDNENYKGSKVTKIIKDNKGNPIGEIRVGIDSRLIWMIYIGILVALVLGGLVVLIIMKIITTIMTKPILRPLNSLQKQMEELADENYENVNPSLTVGKKTVREVYELANVTNRLLNKMVNYNEVITQSEKMASVGQLTAAITHEINTPLGTINSNVNMIKLMAEEASTIDDAKLLLEMNENIKESAALSEQACIRIQEIIKSLRSFSRIDQADFMPADINESIRSVIILTTNLHKNRIHIEEKLGEIPTVSCYIGLINQVFMNIIINAIQAIDGKGIITIETSADEAFVYAKISDTGCGISKKNIYRIFEYGFTTKQPGSGSGIGLALSNNIMKKHNGFILVDSEEGKETTFTVKIPINQEKYNNK
jgi:signal transduction histidine kinase